MELRYDTAWTTRLINPKTVRLAEKCVVTGAFAMKSYTNAPISFAIYIPVSVCQYVFIYVCMYVRYNSLCLILICSFYLTHFSIQDFRQVQPRPARKHLYLFTYEVTVISSKFNRNWNVSTNFHKLLKIQKSWKSV